MSDRAVDSPARPAVDPGREAGPGAAAGKPALVGWIVDVQEDFMNPEGRLYVRDLLDGSDPGAAEVIPALEAATAWMRARCGVIVYTGDWHGLEDDEIDPVAPDPAAGTYPPHCMGRSPDPEERAGAEVIAEIRPRDPVVLAHDATEEDAARVARQAVAERRPVFVQKTRFNVFEGNPACEAFVRSLGEAVGEMAGARDGVAPAAADEEPAHEVMGRALEFVVIGVARDVCVTQAVDGLQARGYAVTAVRDATWGLGLEAEAATLARWAGRGRVVALAELLDG
ncbi:MAG: isochorismatase family protein [Gemmatimonadota bacterium]|nr:isochorismatase family protein [Gemmatimonadota bacterium]